MRRRYPPAKGSLAGVEVSGNSPSPVKECWPELGWWAIPLLRPDLAGRRRQPPRPPAPAKPVLTGGQGEVPSPPAKDPLAGVEVSGNRSSPVKECWPELGGGRLRFSVQTSLTGGGILPGPLAPAHALLTGAAASKTNTPSTPGGLQPPTQHKKPPVPGRPTNQTNNNS